MLKNNHSGNRKVRGKRPVTVQLGYYLIITDTEETEKNYFEGLKNSLPKDMQDQIAIKVVYAKTDKLIERAKEYRAKAPQYCQTWIVLDKDLVKKEKFDKIVSDAEKSDIKVGWSNPCFEIWLAAYFGIMPNWTDSVECCKKFGTLFEQKTGKEYAKNSKSLYNDLIKNGDEEEACEIASRKSLEAKNKSKTPSGQSPATTVYKLVQEIRTKTSP